MKNDQYKYLLQKLNIRNELRNIIKMQQKVEERIVECINRIDGQLKLDVPNKEKPLEEKGKKECGTAALSHLGAPYVPPHRYGKTTKNEEVSMVNCLDGYNSNPKKLMFSHKGIIAFCKEDPITKIWKGECHVEYEDQGALFQNTLFFEAPDFVKAKLAFENELDKFIEEIEGEFSTLIKMDSL